MSSSVRDTVGYVDPRVERTCALLARTAADLVVEGGPGAVSVEAVSSTARVARSTVYRHFPLREDLLVAAIEVLLPALDTVWPGDSTEQRLHLMATHFAEHLNLPSFRAALSAVLAIAASSDQGPHRRFVELHREPLLAVLRDGVGSGELAASTDPESGVSELLGPLLFQALLETSPPSVTDVEAVINSFMRAHAAEAERRPRARASSTRTSLAPA